jgi:hypothetical protein
MHGREGAWTGKRKARMAVEEVCTVDGRARTTREGGAHE